MARLEDLELLFLEAAFLFGFATFFFDFAFLDDLAFVALFLVTFLFLGAAFLFEVFFLLLDLLADFFADERLDFFFFAAATESSLLR